MPVSGALFCEFIKILLQNINVFCILNYFSFSSTRKVKKLYFNYIISKLYFFDIVLTFYKITYLFTRVFLNSCGSKNFSSRFIFLKIHKIFLFYRRDFFFPDSDIQKEKERINIRNKLMCVAFFINRLLEKEKKTFNTFFKSQ